MEAAVKFADRANADGFPNIYEVRRRWLEEHTISDDAGWLHRLAHRVYVWLTLPSNEQGPPCNHARTSHQPSARRRSLGEKALSYIRIEGRAEVVGYHGVRRFIHLEMNPRERQGTLQYLPNRKLGIVGRPFRLMSRV